MLRSPSICGGSKIGAVVIIWRLLSYLKTATTASAACAALRVSPPQSSSLRGGAHVHTAAYAARPHGNRDAPATSHMSLDGSVKLTDGGNVAADLII